MLDTARIRFVYFDLDDTLLDHRRAERDALADCYRLFAETLGEATFDDVHAIYHRHNARLWQDYGSGGISRDDVQRLRFELLVDEIGARDLDPVSLGDEYLACYARHWTWREGAASAFTAASSRVPSGILTNGFSDIQHAKIERFPDLRRRSRAVVISEEVGFLKPHPRIFDYAARQAGTAPENVLYVGDSYQSDVVGGLAAGWQVAWLDGDADAARGAFVFSEWSSLLDRLPDSAT